MSERRPIIIVSGLPRTGTSMMMRMLSAGGVPILTDGVRQADEDNPNGYFEFELVKKVGEDASFLDGARGKAVKLVYRLLYDLPERHDYRVIFMKRGLDEVVASQNIMLQRRGKDAERVDDATVIRMFRKELDKVERWLEGRANFQILFVDYNEVIRRPQRHAARVNDFLDGVLDIEAMVDVVDPSLYRNRR
jgi:hypothetical protein